jgi:lipopolysaccharide export system permease protein
MIPSFFLGVVAFLFILLMFQALRLTEFVLIHGVKLSLVGQMMAYLSTSFLPILFPMSLLFTVLLTYGRLSGDSEIVALKAVGLNMWYILMPALVFGFLVTFLSAQVAFDLAPWANRQEELLLSKVGSMKPAAQIKEGTFSESFFDLVVYANRVDSKTGLLGQVFIYNERDSKSPSTIIAREGHLLLDPEKPGHNGALELVDGSIHTTSEGRPTKIDFSKYTLYFSDPISEELKKKSPPSFTLSELESVISQNELPATEMRVMKTEYHRRWAISTACILFALIGAGLGTTTNRRAARSGGAVICLALIIIYWVLYATGETMAKNAILSPWLAMWLPNMIFSVAAFFSLRRAWR